MAEDLLLLESVGKQRAKEIFSSLFRMAAPKQRTHLRWLIFHMRELRARGGLRNPRAFFVAGTREIVGNEIWCKWVQDLHLQTLAFKFEEEASERHMDRELEAMCTALNQSDTCNDVPQDFLCPISWQIMVEPVVLVDSGQTYDREHITQWLDTKKTDPLTNIPIHVGLLVPNHAVRRMITEFLQLRTSARSSGGTKRKHRRTSSDPTHDSPSRPSQRRKLSRPSESSSAVSELNLAENDVLDNDFITNLPSNEPEEPTEFFGEDVRQHDSVRISCFVGDASVDQFMFTEPSQSPDAAV